MIEKLEMNESKEFLDEMKKLIYTNLPRSHITLLRRLIHFFEHVTRYADVNKMNHGAISIVFGMNILKPKNEDPLLLTQHARYINKITEIMVKNVDFFFPLENNEEEEEQQKQSDERLKKKSEEENEKKQQQEEEEFFDEDQQQQDVNKIKTYAPPPEQSPLLVDPVSPFTTKPSLRESISFRDSTSSTTSNNNKSTMDDIPKIKLEKSRKSVSDGKIKQISSTTSTPIPIDGDDDDESSILKSKMSLANLPIEKKEEISTPKKPVNDIKTSPRNVQVVKNFDPITMTYNKPIENFYKKNNERVLSKPRESLRLWQEIFDVKSQRYYYYNPLTGTTTWDHPSKMSFEQLQKENELLDKLQSNTMFSKDYNFRGRGTKKERNFEEKSQDK